MYISPLYESFISLTSLYMNLLYACEEIIILTIEVAKKENVENKITTFQKFINSFSRDEDIFKILPLVVDELQGGQSFSPYVHIS